MRACPKCGTKNPLDRDFCQCGEYLRWEATGFMPAIPAPAQPAPPPGDEASSAQQAPERPVPAAPSPPPPAAQTPAPPPPPPVREHETYHPPPRAAAPPPPPPPPPEPVAAAEPVAAVAAAITLRLPQDERRVAAGELGIAVVPGQRGRVLALVRNKSEIVDNYDVVVHGIPREWWTATPPTAYLIPLGSGGGFEQEIEIALHPPRSPDAVAGRHDLQIAVFSRAAQAEVAAAPFMLGILPFEDWAVTVKPQRASGRRRARYTVVVENSANASIAVALDAADDDGECAFKFDSVAVDAPAGSRKSTRLQASPPKQIWIGRPLDRRFAILSASGEEGEKLLAAKADAEAEGGRRGLPGKLPKIPGVTPPKIAPPKVSVGPGGVKVGAPQARAPQVRAPRAKAINLVRPTLGLKALRGPDAGEPAAQATPLMPTQAVFRQKPWLPWWLSVVAPILLLIGMLLFLLLPRSVEVPNVVKSVDVAAAEAALIEAKLVLGRKEPRASAKDKPGTIIAQAPAAGQSVKKGSAVSIVYAVGSGDAVVPKLAGLTLEQADAALRKAELQKGTLSVQPPDLKAKIASSLPAAGERVKVGSPVDLFFEKPKEAGPTGAAGVDANGDGKPDKPAAGDIAVPEIKPPDAQGYGQALAKAGLVPGEPERRIDEAKAGTVFATVPPVGTKVAAGTKVTMLVSAGFPRFVFDDDKNVLLASGASGKRISPAVAKTNAVEKDATWSADGERVVYTADNALFAADMQQRGRDPVALRPSQKFVDPSFAPTTKRSVLAAALLVDGKFDDTDLCVGSVGLDDYEAQCIAEPDFGVGMARWSPDGGTILVGAFSDKGSGIVRYTSKVPFSPRKADWGKGEFVTQRSKTSGVFDAVFSPDGKHLAAIANFDTGDPRLYVTAPDDVELKKAKPTAIQACKVGWIDSRWLYLTKLGPECKQGVGEIVRVPFDDLAAPVPLVPEGDNPAFAPLSLGG
jgi:beta-lactam-binding protein with PASTA domain